MPIKRLFWHFKRGRIFSFSGKYLSARHPVNESGGGDQDKGWNGGDGEEVIRKVEEQQYTGVDDQ